MIRLVFRNSKEDHCGLEQSLTFMLVLWKVSFPRGARGWGWVGFKIIQRST